jgi:uncharacterized protein YjeT (DUF2065 family)
MVLLNQGMILNLVHDAAVGPIAIALSGILLFVAGLAILRVHNLWVKGWPVLVTLIGWAAVLSGLARMLFPTLIIQIAGRFLQAVPFALDIAGPVLIAVGVFLSYQAYRRA